MCLYYGRELWVGGGGGNDQHTGGDHPSWCQCTDSRRAGGGSRRVLQTTPPPHGLWRRPGGQEKWV